MAKIPWYLWLGVGAIMFFVSQYVATNLEIFVYVGMFFIIVGIFKLLVAFIVGGKSQKKVEKEAQEIRQQQFMCPRCRNIVASTYTFCPHCATRLRN
jgi:uncharacterized paraquat-inducible protein A